MPGLREIHQEFGDAGVAQPVWVNSVAGLEAVAPSTRSAGCDRLRSMSTWAPFANGHVAVGNGDAGSHAGKDRIAVIGSGNWGSVAAKLVASGARSQACFHGVWVRTNPCL